MARPRSFDERAVVAAARDAFWDRGYAATSVDDLTAATGLGKGSLYGAFGDKHSLFIRALDEYGTDSTATVVAELREPGIPARDRIARHLRSVAEAVAADDERRGCLMVKSAAELGASDVEVERVIRSSYAAWLAALEDCVAEAQDDGTVTKRADPKALASMLFGLIRGLEVLRKGGVAPAQIIAAAEAALTLLD